MKKERYKRGIALLLGCILAVSPCLPGVHVPSGISSQAAERAASVNATNLNVRSGPGTSYQAVAKLSHGASVTVIGEQAGTDGKLWYQIRFSGSGGAAVTGYVSSDYIKFPSAVAADGNFESYMNSQGFPESYKPGLRELHAKYPQWTFTALQTNLDWNTVIENESVIGRNLVGRENISSWKSTAPGAYDWDTGTWPGFDGSAWVQASEDIIRYYMDPRNFLNEKYIFQFMNQSYNSSLHTREGLESMVAGTFLSGSASAGQSGGSGSSSPGGGPSGGPSGPASGPASGPGMDSSAPGTGGSPISPVASISDHQVDRVTTSVGPGLSGPGGFSSPDGGSTDPAGGDPGNSDPGVSASVTGSVSYVDIIMNAAAQSGVSPYILASMIIQEQGSQGTGRSISGTVAGYQGYYNFFNVEAYQSGSLGAVERGLWWASQSGSYGRPWNSVERSILGGAAFYGANYVQKGQNTLYLKKFNVQGDNLYKHQYMTNVLAAAAEGLTLAKIDALKTTALEFSIPVYKNMPETACAKPATDGSPNNKLSGLGVEGFALTPTFNRDTESYDLIVDPSVSSVNVIAAAIDSKAVVTGTGTVDLQSGVNDITVSIKAENGAVRNYVLHVVRQQNGPVYSDAIGNNISSGSSSGPGGFGPGGSSSGPGTGSGGGSDVQIIAPDGSGSSGSSGSGSSGPIAPGTGNVSGFGSTGGSADLVGPDGTIISGAGTPGGNAPGGSGSGGNSPGASVPGGNSPGNVTPGGSSSSGGNPGGTTGTGYGTLVKGDNTGDGKLDIKDVLRAQRHILGLETLTGSAAEATDVNGNGKIDVMDILMMQKDILGLQKLN